MFEQLQIKFSKDTTWKKSDRCGWNLPGCLKKINITQEQYYLKGNMCEKCTTKINLRLKEINMEREIKNIEIQIKVLRQEMDKLGDKLEQEMSEEARATIVYLMEQKYARIRELMGLL